MTFLFSLNKEAHQRTLLYFQPGVQIPLLQKVLPLPPRSRGLAASTVGSLNFYICTKRGFFVCLASFGGIFSFCRHIQVLYPHLTMTKYPRDDRRIFLESLLVNGVNCRFILLMFPWRRDQRRARREPAAHTNSHRTVTSQGIKGQGAERCSNGITYGPI